MFAAKSTDTVLSIVSIFAVMALACHKPTHMRFQINFTMNLSFLVHSQIERIANALLRALWSTSNPSYFEKFIVIIFQECMGLLIQDRKSRATHSPRII
jgi:hypothetical protein